MDPVDPHAALSFNPRVALTLERRGGELVAIAVEAPTRGQPLRRTRFLAAREPAIVELLERVARRAGGVEVALDAAAWSRLAASGVLLPASAVPPPVRFRCTPGEVPVDLWPARARRASPAGALVVDPSLVLRDAADPGGAAGPFADEPASATVSPAGVLVPCFLAVPEAQRALFRALTPGAPPGELPPGARAALLEVGVLCDPVAAERRRRARAEELAAATAALRRSRCAVVRDLFHPAQLAALRRYYRDLVAEGYVRLGDRQVSGRYAATNEPLSRALHGRLTGLASALAGAPMRPSYTYFVAYLEGASLAPHLDRAACELSVSVLIDESPEPEGPSSWPLCLETPDGAVALQLGLGDGAVFYGRELRHSRPPLAAGRRSTSLLLHFVPEGFRGRLV
jgi:hypothetical protein